MYLFIYSCVKPFPLLMVPVLLHCFLELRWEKERGKERKEGKKKKKKKASRLLPHTLKNMSYFLTCHSTRVPDLVRSHIPQRFYTHMGIREKKKKQNLKTPSTKYHGDLPLLLTQEACRVPRRQDHHIVLKVFLMPCASQTPRLPAVFTST